MTVHLTLILGQIYGNMKEANMGMVGFHPVAFSSAGHPRCLVIIRNVLSAIKYKGEKRLQGRETCEDYW